ncbi:MAG: glutathione S-transferase [Thermoleophilaceae bacterium]|jgi:glutathione S-transferase|nr:glutathione S-transferase [Thermoleophilaceae bacterium]
MKATLFGVPASHPSLAAELMLRHKAIDYRRIDLVAAVHRLALRGLGFRGKTVPALRLDGTRVQGTREIALALDSLRPDPPLFPADPERRSAVVAAEAWGDEAYQPVPRRLVWAALRRDRSTLRTYLEDARVGIPVPLAARTAPPVIRAAARLNDATDDNVRRDLAALPSLFNHVDALLRAGTIGGVQPNVADFQIATTTALLATLEDVRPLLDGRPAAEHARRIAPRYPGRMPRVFPPEWLQG